MATSSTRVGWAGHWLMLALFALGAVWAGARAWHLTVGGEFGVAALVAVLAALGFLSLAAREARAGRRQ